MREALEEEEEASCSRSDERVVTWWMRRDGGGRGATVVVVKKATVTLFVVWCKGRRVTDRPYRNTHAAPFAIGTYHEATNCLDGYDYKN